MDFSRIGVLSGESTFNDELPHQLGNTLGGNTVADVILDVNEFGVDYLGAYEVAPYLLERMREVAADPPCNTPGGNCSQ